MIKGIFFDVGGTLCKTSSENKIEPSFKRVLSIVTRRSLTDFNVKKQGYLWTTTAPKQELVIRLCRELEIEDWRAVYEALNKYSFNVSLYDDVITCLNNINKYKLGLLSNTTVWTAFDHVKLGLSDFINLSILSCKVGYAKPDCEIFELAEEAIGFGANELLYVGDTIEYDIEPALKANWNAVLICREKDIKESPAPIIHNLSELNHILSEM